MITKMKLINSVLIATEIRDMQQVPSAVIDDSSLVIHTYFFTSAGPGSMLRPRPDHPRFAIKDLPSGRK